MYGTYQRQHYATFVTCTILFIVALLGCDSSTHQNPETVYRNIHREFLRGDLGMAQQDAEKARKQVWERSPDWDIKFRLLEAEILTYQGSSQDVIQLLGGDPSLHHR